MLTIEEVRLRMQDRKIPVVAHETGLHYNTVRRIVADPNFVPSYETVKLLSDYLTKDLSCVVSPR